MTKTIFLLTAINVLLVIGNLVIVQQARHDYLAGTQVIADLGNSILTNIERLESQQNR